MALKYKKFSISLDEHSEEVVDGLVDEKGLNFSAAMRWIVWDWAKLKRRPTHSIQTNETYPVVLEQ